MSDAMTVHAQPCMTALGGRRRDLWARSVLMPWQHNTMAFLFTISFKVGDKGVEEDGVVLGREEMKTPVASAV